MTEGRWQANRRALEPLPLELPYLCDWTTPIVRLDSLRIPAGSARRPGLLILIGTLDDCADAFVDRARRADLPRTLDAEGLPVHDPRFMDWPGDPEFASSFLHRALDARPEWEMEKKLPEGLTTVKTTTSSWDSGKEAVLERLLVQWRGAEWTLPSSRRLLLVLSIVSSTRASSARVSSARDGAVHRQVEELVQRNAGIPATVITLPEVERGDAVNWASLPQVRSRCRPESREDLAGDIWKLYERAGNSRLPMKPLASGLLRLLEQYRQTEVAV